MLNIGGIANFTFLPGSLDADAVFCSDTGTGNTLMDAYMRKHFQLYFDENAAVAMGGIVHRALLAALKNNAFFQQPFPKTTGPELFNTAYLENALQTANAGNLSHADVMATLNRFSAETIAEAIKAVTDEGKGFHFYVSGGGMHNPLLMRNLAELLPGCTFKSTKELHINPDAKEAVLFAVLANEAICGGSVNFGKGRNGIPNVSMGKISFPG
ncbi:anhydro-N-acetylmuramic acid kinase [Chitinophaga sedimenti]|nr:anhydro-N-acetylmuramic acid kinase [Chitinophaga sedimenti]MCK7557111.1 anhydro-N-acetylmuramic acid kinase [Chitinophaga sedimenti]